MGVDSGCDSLIGRGGRVFDARISQCGLGEDEAGGIPSSRWFYPVLGEVGPKGLLSGWTGGETVGFGEEVVVYAVVFSQGVWCPEWWVGVCRYVYPGKEGVFLLHCSLQETTQRLFIQVSEDGNRQNVQVMGLQVDRSVPDSDQFREAIRVGTWEGVVRNQNSVVEMFKTYVSGPLLRKAQPSMKGDQGSENRGRFDPNLEQMWIGLGLVAVIFFVISKSRS